MKKISVLLILALLLCSQAPTEAKIFTEYKARIEQNKITKNTISEIKAVLQEQTKQADKHCLEGLKSLYSKDFVNSDGFTFDTYMKMVEETWETYPDITYTTEINSIDFSDNYASVYVTETAVAAPKEKIGEFETIGELYSTSKCIYNLEKHGTIWLITSEKMLEETSTLRYGDARYINIKLDAPNQIGAGKYYTSTLKIEAPKDYTIVASISKENIVYPQTKSEDTFRRVPDDNVLERVFLSNKDNVNEYTIASVGLTHALNINNKELRVYMNGLAFIMTRVNVIPENKFVKQTESKKDGKNK